LQLQGVIRMSSVTLSSIHADDSEILFRWINDPETVRFNAPYRPVHWANHEDWVRSLAKATNKVAFAVRASGRLIGVVQLVDIDLVHRSAELTIRLGDEDDRGRGYGTAALKLAIDHAWRDLNLHRVWLRVFEDNLRAIQAYKKAGFKQEGVMREAAYIDGRYVGLVIMGTLNPTS
jgi:UDP-4-amino-4,6-dideoxy-N-acetyl-beta-L-altrosamine N-acetyltransferase